MPAQLHQLSRKARRKEERKSHKRKRKQSTAPAATMSRGAKVARPAKKTAQAAGTKLTTARVPLTVDENQDRYAHLDPVVANALRRDDQEIDDLERKLGMSHSKDRQRLSKEYAKLEGYGEDFGDFLSGLDDILGGGGGPDDRRNKKLRLMSNPNAEGDERSVGTSLDSDDEDEIIPMKDAAPNDDDMDEDDSVLDELEAEEAKPTFVTSAAGGDVSASDAHESDELDTNGAGSSSSENENDDGDSVDVAEPAIVEPDHDKSLVYRPTRGEDIYGNPVSSNEPGSLPSKYVPPSLRAKAKEPLAQLPTSENDDQNKDAMSTIQRSLNGLTNRLSEDTIISIASSVAKLYADHPTSYVNECVWTNILNACVRRPTSMTTLIPVYVACFCGVHVEKGDVAQLGEHLMEHAVTALWEALPQARQVHVDDEEADVVSNKEAGNLVLIVCYLYNFSIVHCSLIYDIVRQLLDNFTSVDVELLLMILTHCGRALRSDDPLALKGIVASAQQRASKATVGPKESRAEFMLSAMADLKNNKRRNQDAAIFDTTAKLRKILGQVKTKLSSGKNAFRLSDASLRIKLDDILQANIKGRWWKVGASWSGNQHRFREDESEDSPDRASDLKSATDEVDSVADTKLLLLAAKYRMNSDSKRSSFCIIMSASDCDDAFEKLVRAGMVKNRAERDTIRVLIECCGHEKAYNPFYAHLAARICEFQPESRFTLQLAIWDTFKLFENMKARKAANLANFMFHMVVKVHKVKLNVLKQIDMGSPGEISASGMIFLTMFLTKTLEHFGNPDECRLFFERGSGTRHGHDSANAEVQESRMREEADAEAFRSNLTVFLLEVMKKSPKYTPGSKFYANLKVAVKACDPDNFF